MIIQDIHEFSSLKQKSKIFKILKNFVVFIQTQVETTIKVIKNDNGTKFFMTNFFINKEIIHQISCVNTSQKNSIIERKPDVARALMIQFIQNLLVIFCYTCCTYYKHASHNYFK